MQPGVGACRRVLETLMWDWIHLYFLVHHERANVLLQRPDFVHYLEDWWDHLEKASGKPGRVIDEALVDAQMRVSDRLAGYQVPAALATESLKQFALALDKREVGSLHGRIPARWVRAAIRFPKPEGPTKDDRWLAEYVAGKPAEVDLEGHEGITDLSPLASIAGLKKLTLLFQALLTDLSPLARLTSLEDLEVVHCRIRDLTPLGGLSELRELRLHVEASDVSPLGNLAKLEKLELHTDDRVTDAKPLGQLHALRMLDLRGVAGPFEWLGELGALETLKLALGRTRADLSSLARLSRLTTLDISGSFTNIDFVRGLDSLEELHVHSEVPIDVAALTSLPKLVKLKVGMTEITDLSPIARLENLRELDIAGDRRLDASFLSGLTKLEKLDAAFVDMESLAPLASLEALKCLELTCTRSVDLRPLAGLTSLEQIKFDDTGSPVRDIGPLAGLVRMKVLDLAGSAVRDLRPLSGMKELVRLNLQSCEKVRDIQPLANLRKLAWLCLESTAIETVEPLAGLPDLEFVDVGMCDSLQSILPLAKCPKLDTVLADNCDNLKGPRTLADLKRTLTQRQPTAKSFPSAGPEEHPAPGPKVFDARNHLPKRPPQGWSVPESSDPRDRDPRLPPQYAFDAGGVTAVVSLIPPDTAMNTFQHHALYVWLTGPGRSRLKDPEVARVLRRFRSCGAFVEVLNDEHLDEMPSVRLFMTRAEPASESSWGQVRIRPKKLVVEPPVAAGDEAKPDAVFDIRNHLPSPLPAGWTVKGPQDDKTARFVTEDADIIALLGLEDGSDVFELGVGIMPRRGEEVPDHVARAILVQFGARAEFREGRLPPEAKPGSRFFKAKALPR